MEGTNGGDGDAPDAGVAASAGDAPAEASEARMREAGAAGSDGDAAPAVPLLKSARGGAEALAKRDGARQQEKDEKMLHGKLQQEKDEEMTHPESSYHCDKCEKGLCQSEALIDLEEDEAEWGWGRMGGWCGWIEKDGEGQNMI